MEPGMLACFTDLGDDSVSLLGGRSLVIQATRKTKEVNLGDVHDVHVASVYETVTLSSAKMNSKVNWLQLQRSVPRLKIKLP